MLTNFKKRRAIANQDDGYAIVAVLAISFLAVIIVSSITAITISDLMFNAKVRAAIEARHAAESATDSYYAAINVAGNSLTNDSGEVDILVASQVFQTADEHKPIMGPFVLESGVESTSIRIVRQTDFSQEWFSTNDDGDLGLCDLENGTDPCFRMRLKEINTRPYTTDAGEVLRFGADTRTEYSLDIVVMHKCTNRSDPANLRGCTFSRFQQQIREREFINHLIMSETEEIPTRLINLMPEGPIRTQLLLKAADPNEQNYNSYANDDSIDGNIHTNADAIHTCDSFGLAGNNWVTSNLNKILPAYTPEPGTVAGFDECQNAGFAGPDIILRAQREDFSLPTRSGDERGSRLKALAASDNRDLYVLPQNSTIQLLGNQMLVEGINGGSPYPLPNFGVVFVEGNVTVYGTLKGRLTIFSERVDNARRGDIQIGIDGKNNLVYDDSSPSSNDLLGLLASGDIILNCDAGPGLPCREKTVHGLLRAGTPIVNSDGTVAFDGGSIYNPRWHDSSTPYPAVARDLIFHGAMISEYRGTFGSMVSSNVGNVSSGWKKNFSFDERLKYQQPPYMLRDALAVFIRSTAKDLPCDEFCTSVIS